MRRRSALALLLLALAVTPPLRGEVAIPPFRARVTDFTGTLDPAAREALENRLHAFEDRRGSQIAVLIVPTTEPETIEQYAMRVAESWKLGRKGVDDGAILLVAMKDRTVRIEVGYGLEGVLNDATCKRIISEVITPEFRRGDIRAGIGAGIDAMLRLVEGEALPTPAPWPHEGEGAGGSSTFFFVVVLAIGAANALRPLVGRLGAAVLIGLGMWLVSSFVVSASVAVLVGLLTFVVALFGPAGASWASGRRGYAGGAFGGGSGGRGFGGGGGGFGGGGASGRW